jgi:hypothetical protein
MEKWNESEWPGIEKLSRLSMTDLEVTHTAEPLTHIWMLFIGRLSGRQPLECGAFLCGFD